MDLLQEAKKSNKQAYVTLVEKYNHIFYKLVKIYFLTDREVYAIIKKSLNTTFRELANVKTEKDFLRLSIRILISNCQVEKKKQPIAPIESAMDQRIYKDYLNNSFVAEYINSFDETQKLIAILYYYAELSEKDISKILKLSTPSIKNILNIIRAPLLETIKSKEVY